MSKLKGQIRLLEGYAQWLKTPEGQFAYTVAKARQTLTGDKLQQLEETFKQYIEEAVPEEHKPWFYKVLQDN